MGNVWAAKNPEKWREYKREWYRKNKEKQASYRQKWEEKNPDYWESNKEHRKAKAAKYWSDNKHSLVPQSLLRAAKRRAKAKGMECSITLEDISVPEKCPLLDIPLFVGDGRQGPNSPSLDRIDNTKGYVRGNIWVISHKANAAKGDLTAEELIQIGTRLRNTLAEGASI